MNMLFFILGAYEIQYLALGITLAYWIIGKWIVMTFSVQHEPVVYSSHQAWAILRSASQHFESKEQMYGITRENSYR